MGADLVKLESDVHRPSFKDFVDQKPKLRIITVRFQPICLPCGRMTFWKTGAVLCVSYSVCVLCFLYTLLKQVQECVETVPYANGVWPWSLRSWQLISYG